MARPDAPAFVFAIVDRPDCAIQLDGDGDIRVTWVHRAAAPGERDQLLEAVAAADMPSGSVDVFVHGEASEVRAVRRHLLAQRGISGSSISPYWRRDFTDEAWREVKTAWVEQMHRDA